MQICEKIFNIIFCINRKLRILIAFRFYIRSLVKQVNVEFCQDILKTNKFIIQELNFICIILCRCPDYEDCLKTEKLLCTWKDKQSRLYRNLHLCCWRVYINTLYIISRNFLLFTCHDKIMVLYWARVYNSIPCAQYWTPHWFCLFLMFYILFPIEPLKLCVFVNY